MLAPGNHNTANTLSAQVDYRIFFVKPFGLVCPDHNHFALLAPGNLPPSFPAFCILLSRATCRQVPQGASSLAAGEEPACPGRPIQPHRMTHNMPWAPTFTPSANAPPPLHGEGWKHKPAGCCAEVAVPMQHQHIPVLWLQAVAPL